MYIEPRYKWSISHSTSYLRRRTKLKFQALQKLTKIMSKLHLKLNDNAIYPNLQTALVSLMSQKSLRVKMTMRATAMLRKVVHLCFPHPLLSISLDCQNLFTTYSQVILSQQPSWWRSLKIIYTVETKVSQTIIIFSLRLQQRDQICCQINNIWVAAWLSLPDNL